jgi:hypothetical protein
MALLNQEYAKLKTPKMYDEAINAYNESVAKWTEQVENANERVRELRTVSQPLININVNNLRDVETIRTTIQDINNTVNTVQAAANDVTNIVVSLEEDINTARRLETDARNAFTDDLNYLKSLIDLESGAAFAAIEPFLFDILSDVTKEYIEYGLLALDALEKIKMISAQLPVNEKPQREPRVVFRGRDVHYPTTNYPAFYLGVAASDFSLDTWNWSFDLRNISSNPDMTGGAVSLNLGLREDGGALRRTVSFNGKADLRTNPQERFNAVVAGNGFPVSLGDDLSKLGINGFLGAMAFSVNASGRPDGGFSTGGDININEAQLLDPRGTIAEAVDYAVRVAEIINLGVQFTHYVDRNDEFIITTNIGDLITQALLRTAEIYARRALDEIERVLRLRINEYINRLNISRDQIDTLFNIARGDKTAIEQTQNALNAKKEELEQRIITMATGAAQQAADDAARQTEQVIQGVLPSLPAIPGLPGRN